MRIAGPTALRAAPSAETGMAWGWDGGSSMRAAGECCRCLPSPGATAGRGQLQDAFWDPLPHPWPSLQAPPGSWHRGLPTLSTPYKPHLALGIEVGIVLPQRKGALEGRHGGQVGGKAHALAHVGGAGQEQEVLGHQGGQKLQAHGRAEQQAGGEAEALHPHKGVMAALQSWLPAGLADWHLAVSIERDGPPAARSGGSAAPDTRLC